MEAIAVKVKKSSERKLLQVREWQEQNRPHYLKKQKEWRKAHPNYIKRWRESHHQQCLHYAKKSYRKNHDKCNARNESRASRFPRDSRCAKCGATENLEGHHLDYSKPLLVITVCRECHRQIHGVIL